MSVIVSIDEFFKDHHIPTEPDHPENPERIAVIQKALENKNVAFQKKVLADEGQIVSLHDYEYVTKVQNGDKNINVEDAYINRDSYECTKYAVGTTFAVSQKLANKKYKCGFVAVRPPGHHACTNKASGFCIFNNVALCARNIITRHKLVKRVVILDIDIHHGDGTQKMLYDDPNIFYISIHRKGPDYFPYSGHMTETGYGEGVGKNMNIPLEHSGINDDEYLYLLQMLVIPRIKKFRPSQIIVSCGFDAMKDDKIGDCNLTEKFYRNLTQELLNLNVPHGVMFVLEGGYTMKNLSNASSTIVDTMVADEDWKPKYDLDKIRFYIDELMVKIDDLWENYLD